MVNPLQTGRSSGLRSRLSGGGISFKPGDVGYFKSNPGAGWILANAAQSIDSILYPKFRADAKGLYTTAQTDTNADANTNAYNGVKNAFRHTDNFIYFNGPNPTASIGNALWKKTAWNAEPVLVSNVANPGNWYYYYKFCGIHNNVAVFITQETANSTYWGIMHSTNADFTTWSSFISLTAAPSERLRDVLWTGTRWLVAGFGIYNGATLNSGMTVGTNNGGPANASNTRWARLWKVGSIIYAQGADNEYWAKSTDDGLSWTVYLPTGGPYRHQDPSVHTAQYAPTYNLWFGVNTSNQLVYTTDPTTTWTLYDNLGGGYNYGFQILDMPDPGGILVCSQNYIYLLNMQSNTIESYMNLGAYAWNVNQTPVALFRDGTTTYIGTQDVRWKRIYTPLDRCNPPTLAAINNRTPYMRVSA